MYSLVIRYINAYNYIIVPIYIYIYIYYTPINTVPPIKLNSLNSYGNVNFSIVPTIRLCVNKLN